MVEAWVSRTFTLALVLLVYGLFGVIGGSSGAAGEESSAQSDVAGSLGWPHVLPQWDETDSGSVPEEEPSGFAEDHPFWVSELEPHSEPAEGPVEPDQSDALLVAALALRDIASSFRETQRILLDIESLHRQRLDELTALVVAMQAQKEAARVDENLRSIHAELRRLNLSVEIMAAAIDTTIGRMGRLAPYGW